MRLSSVAIEKFRGISSLTINLERDITVLIGENNSGKSTILEALRFGLNTIKSDKSCNFTEYDFYRDSQHKDLSSSEPIVFIFVFEESEPYPWPADVLQALNEVIVGDKYSVIKLRLTAWFDKGEGEIKQIWSFLDDADNEMTGKQSSIKDIRRLRPFFFQSALRAAKDEFHGQSTYWSSFLKNKDIDQTTRKTLEDELQTVNQKIVAAHASFKDVTEEVNRITELVTVGKSASVSVDTAQADVYKALRYAEVNLLTDSNAKIPIRSHGEGTQSLSVLLLFSAYLKTRLKADVDKLAEPIIAIEEPEAHLHPSSVRSLWELINDLPGQKIISTHSGDILSEVPIQKLRRLNKTATNNECRAIDPSLLSSEELRKFNHHVRRNRGELLFAKLWLLVEGETDVSVFVECAELLGINLHRHGIRVIECSQAGGPGIFIKVADALGIKWHVVADNDDGGNKYVRAAMALLDDRVKEVFVSQLSSSNMDVLLCQSGYGAPYLDGIATQARLPLTGSWEDVLEEMKKTFIDKPAQALSVAKKLEDRSRPEIVADEDTPEYWEQVYRCLKNGFSKPEAALKSILLMKNNGIDAVPVEIKAILTKIAAQTGDT